MANNNRNERYNQGTVIKEEQKALEGKELIE